MGQFDPRLHEHIEWSGHFFCRLWPYSTPLWLINKWDTPFAVCPRRHTSQMSQITAHNLFNTLGLKIFFENNCSSICLTNQFWKSTSSWNYKFLKNDLWRTSKISHYIKLINILIILKLQCYSKRLCNESNKKGTWICFSPWIYKHLL